MMAGASERDLELGFMYKSSSDKKREEEEQKKKDLESARKEVLLSCVSTLIPV